MHELDKTGLRIWFDTEFIEDGRTIDLISIGLVREDGETYYAECAEADLSRADQWVRDNVIVHLTGETKPRAQIAEEIRAFVGAKPEFWAYYADYDWIALCQLYGRMIDLPDSWPMFCRDLKQVCAERGDPVLPAQGTEHHALADAKWNRDVHAYLSSTSAGVTEEQTPRVTEAMIDAGITAMPKDAFFLIYESDMRVILEAALEASRSPVSQKEAVPVAWWIVQNKHGEPVGIGRSEKEAEQNTGGMRDGDKAYPVYASPAHAGEVVQVSRQDALDRLLAFILSDDTPVGPEDEDHLRMFQRATEVAQARLTGAAGMTVIDPDQWEPCSPSYLVRGGRCCDAPRVWNGVEGTHWHPKISSPSPAPAGTAKIAETAISAYLASTSAGVTEEQTPRDGLLAALRKAEAHIAITSGNGETDLRNELKVAIAKAEASLTCAMGDEMVEAALNVKPFDDGDENVQYILLRGLSAIGFKLPSHATWDVMRAALEASRSPVSQKEAVPVAVGWLYDNEDTGREFSEQHPVDSGEVSDATNIVPATADNLLHELRTAWADLADSRQITASPSPAHAGEPAIKALQAKLDAANHLIDQLHGPLSVAALTARADTALCALEAAVDALKHSKPVMDHYPEARARHDTALADGKAVITELRSALHPSPTPVSAPVGVVEKWPEPGDKMQFLDRNGYDVELEAARKVFTKGQVVTVKKFDLGGWCSSITFEELPGKWNSVMFARSPAVEGK